jgi:hypothetical protein
MLFTFMTITYNHEKFIIQHLESIKYQIINYGLNYKFQLLISDDNSKDNTIEKVKLWVKENNALFEYIDILENEVNQGTCKNYTKAIRYIKGEYYKSLAGDDIFAKDNIFKAIELLHSYDIVSSIIGPFDDKGLYKDRKIYSRIYSMYKFVNTDYSKLANNLTLFPMTPGIFIRKELYTEQVLSFIEQFYLVEDRSRAIKIYEDNKNLKIGYYDKVTVLYRYHDNAITKTKNNKIATGFLNDLDKLDNYVLKTSNNTFLKLRTRYNMANRKIKNSKLALLLNLDVLFYRIGFVLNYHKYRDRIKSIIEESFLPNEKHLKYIISEAEKYE